MKYITVKLTEEQLRFLVLTLETTDTQDFYRNAGLTGFRTRLVNKLRKARVS